MKKSLLLFVVAVLLFSSFGCGINNTHNIETETLETTNGEVTSIEDVSQNITISNDFDSETNSIDSFFGITYQVPTEWEEYGSDDYTRYYYPGEGMLMISKDESLPIGDSKTQEEFWNGLSGSFEESELIEITKCQIDNSKAVRYKANVKDSNNSFYMDVVAFNSSECLIVFLMGTYSGKLIDYSFDFDKILASIEILNIPEDTTKIQETTIIPETTKAPDTTKIPETTKVPVTTKEPETELPEVGMTINQKNALKQAKSYLDFSNFSYQGLIEQLQYEGFSYSDAKFAVDNCEANWNEQALEKAKSYIKFSFFSYNGLKDQLEYEEFTSSQINYAVDNCGADWNEQALGKAKSYLEFSAFSYNGLKDQLEYEEFTSSQINYAVDNCGADWNEQAVKKAKSYLEYMSFSYQGLVEQLEYEGFTHAQAVYGANSTGLN